MKIQIERVEVKANPRKLLGWRQVSRRGKRKFVWRAQWKMMPAKDIVCHHSLDFDEEFLNAVFGVRELP
jgi:hypothetical protein